MKLKKATMVYKSLHRLAPEYLCSRFAIRETACNLRDSDNKLCIPFPRINYYKNSFSYFGAILWNKVPCTLRQAESRTKFKCLLKQVLKGTAFMESSFFFNIFIIMWINNPDGQLHRLLSPVRSECHSYHLTNSSSSSRFQYRTKRFGSSFFSSNGENITNLTSLVISSIVLYLYLNCK